MTMLDTIPKTKCRWWRLNFILVKTAYEAHRYADRYECILCSKKEWVYWNGQRR